MAQDKDRDRDRDRKRSDEESEDKKPGGSKWKLIIIISVVALIAVGAGVGVTLMLNSKHSDKVAEKTQEAGAQAEAEAAPKTPPEYMAFSPAFVVNFQPTKNVRARFLSVELDAVVSSKDMIDQIKLNMPAVRNGIIMLLSRQTYDDLIKPDGKEKLRGEILSEVQKTLRETTGKPGVKDIYFTSFVMQ